MRALQMVPGLARRLAPALAVGVFGAFLAVSPVDADEPGALDFIDWEPYPMASTAPASAGDPSSRSRVPVPPAPPPPPEAATPTPSPRPTPTPTPTPADVADNDGIGFDISYPQCGRSYPDGFAFAIVGVDGGRVFSENPCLVAPAGRSQLEWAGRDADLYFNTGNPGPRSSRHWPQGQDQPRECDTRANAGVDTAECSFLYGWNAAEDSYARALAAYEALDWVRAGASRLPADVRIWLDVEVANSWRVDRRLNVAALDGAVAYLESMGVDRIGFYSTPRMWYRITGGTDAFAEYPAWHAGARSREDAERRCADRAFTGGELVMVQWIENGLDHNIRCNRR